MNRANIIIIISLLLMLVFILKSWDLYSRVEEEKNKVEEEKNKNEKLSDSLRQQLNSNFVLQKKTDSLANLLFTSKGDSSKARLLNNLKSVRDSSAKLNDLPTYERAMLLEKQAFTALVNNQFDTALTRFTTIVKISPYFHMAYEISRLLKKNKEKFSDEQTQKEIKKEIVVKYSWGAPKDLLSELENQAAP